MGSGTNMPLSLQDAMVHSASSRRGSDHGSPDKFAKGGAHQQSAVRQVPAQAPNHVRDARARELALQREAIEAEFAERRGHRNPVDRREGRVGDTTEVAGLRERGPTDKQRAARLMWGEPPAASQLKTMRRSASDPDLPSSPTAVQSDAGDLADAKAARLVRRHSFLELRHGQLLKHSIKGASEVVKRESDWHREHICAYEAMKQKQKWRNDMIKRDAGKGGTIFGWRETSRNFFESLYNKKQSAKMPRSHSNPDIQSMDEPASRQAWPCEVAEPRQPRGERSLDCRLEAPLSISCSTDEDDVSNASSASRANTRSSSGEKSPEQSSSRSKWVRRRNSSISSVSSVTSAIASRTLMLKALVGSHRFRPALNNITSTIKRRVSPARLDQTLSSVMARLTPGRSKSPTRTRRNALTAAVRTNPEEF